MDSMNSTCGFEELENSKQPESHQACVYGHRELGHLNRNPQEVDTLFGVRILFGHIDCYKLT